MGTMKNNLKMFVLKHSRIKMEMILYYTLSAKLHPVCYFRFSHFHCLSKRNIQFLHITIGSCNLKVCHLIAGKTCLYHTLTTSETCSTTVHLVSLDSF